MITIDQKTNTVTVMLTEAETKLLAVYLQHPIEELELDNPVLLDMVSTFRSLASEFDTVEGKVVN